MKQAQTELRDFILCPNGNVITLGEINKPLKGWMTVYWEYLESQGIDPSTLWIEAQLNHGEWQRVIPFRTEYGWNVDFSDPKPF